MFLLSFAFYWLKHLHLHFYLYHNLYLLGLSLNLYLLVHLYLDVRLDLFHGVLDIFFVLKLVPTLVSTQFFCHVISSLVYSLICLRFQCFNMTSKSN